jgi:hypothetical protein
MADNFSDATILLFKDNCIRYVVDGCLNLFFKLQYLNNS